MARSGVPVGYSHRWRYRGVWAERKVAPKTWRFRYSASKSRSSRARGVGSMPVGGRVHWRIRGEQRAVKVSRNRYRIVTTGVKRLVGRG